MVRGNKFWWIAGFFFFLVALLVTVPAAIMEWLLPKVSENRLHLQGTQGGLWEGGADKLLLTVPNSEARQLGRVKWGMRWLSILRGELAVALELPDGAKASHCVVALAPWGYRLRQADVSLPVSVLSDFFPHWKLWQLGGGVVVRTNYLEFGPGGLEGDAVVRWQDASSGLSKLNPLGQYELNVKNGKLQLATLSGVMRLSGSGEWGGQGLRFEGIAQAEPGNSAELQDFMRLLGKEEANGVVKISVSPVRQQGG